MPVILTTGFSGPHEVERARQLGFTRMLEKPFTVEQMIEIVPAPDLPTAPLILGPHGARSAYHTGRGSISMRARHVIKEGRGDRRSIVLKIMESLGLQELGYGDPIEWERSI